MSRTVMCRKFNKELEALDSPPYPGKRGQALFNTVSKMAWQSWLKHQTMLINEKHLSLVDPETQQYLSEQLEKFLDNKDFDRAEGYVPPKDS
ncbi:MAG: oxidative damage protection protein [Pseudomonadales bacterium]|nr:oxidative damage protection protein [Pseudomonadales bacterium]